MKTHLSKLFVRRLIFTTLLVLLLGITAWFAGMWLDIFPKVGLLRCFDGRELVITTDPLNSNVWVNGESVGISPVSVETNGGNITIRVVKELYETFEQTYERLESDELYITLRFNPSVELISRNSNPPDWDNTGNLVHFDYEEQGLLFRNPDWEIKRSLEVDSFIDSMDFLLTNDLIGLGEGALMNVIVLIPVSADSSETVGYSSAAPCWHPSNGQYFFLGWTADTFWGDIDLWAGKLDQAPIRVSLPQTDKIEYPTSVAWSGDGRYLMVQSLDHVDIWHFTDGLLEYSDSQPAAHARWAPTGNKLVYLDVSSNLIIYQAENKTENILLKNWPFDDLAWSPDGNLIYGTTYNPKIGGSAFWEVDVVNGSAQMLINSQRIFGKVTNFALSPDGKQIAYVNYLGQMSVLSIGS